jgi:beta-glucosidase
LSYTTFSYTKLNVYANRGVPYSHTVAFEVSNTGAVPGAEIPQLYLGFPLSAGEPPKVLRGFTKARLPSPLSSLSSSMPLRSRRDSLR